MRHIKDLEGRDQVCAIFVVLDWIVAVVTDRFPRARVNSKRVYESAMADYGRWPFLVFTHDDQYTSVWSYDAYGSIGVRRQHREGVKANRPVGEHRSHIENTYRRGRRGGGG